MPRQSSSAKRATARTTTRGFRLRGGPRVAASLLALLLLALSSPSVAQPGLECRASATIGVEGSATSAALVASNRQFREGAPEAALAGYRESERIARAAGDADAATLAAANAARAAVAAGELDGVEAALTALVEGDSSVGHGVDRAHLRIHVARSWVELARVTSGSRSAAARENAAKLLDEVAETTSDARLRSYALGYRAEMLAAAGQLAAARRFTRRALLEADRAAAVDARFRWLWQLGRISRGLGDLDAAIDAYRRAIADLAMLRADLAIESAAAAFSFRSEVEPAYLEFVDLLLQRAHAQPLTARQPMLVEARDTVESLKAAEISEHFHDPCLSAQQQVTPEQIPGTIVLYPVELPDRVELIVGTDAGLSLHRAAITPDALANEVQRFRRLLTKRTSREYLSPAKQLYEALIRPIAQVIDSSGAQVLVVVPGGALRTVPFAAFYDGTRREYLVEQLPLAVSPGLSLTDPRRIQTSAMRGLVAGISESVQGYPALEYVAGEVASVSERFPSVVLLNGEFSVERFEDVVENNAVGIVHIASHGEFLPDSSESFLLAHDSKLSMDQLAATVASTRYRTEQPLELLVLSACETATGDERAALGLAGVALQAGARSALATLWSVNDLAASEIVARFYSELANGASRAEALRTAQTAMLEQLDFRHPIYWSPFLLISSWL